MHCSIVVWQIHIMIMFDVLALCFVPETATVSQLYALRNYVTHMHLLSLHV